MKKILYLSGYQIFPPFTGGHIRSANVVHGLARAGSEVRVYALGGRGSDYKKRLRSGASDIDQGITEYVNRGFLRGMVQSFFQRAQIAPIWQTILGLKKNLDPVLEEHLAWADTVVINHTYAYSFLRHAAGKTRILNSHNLEHRMWNEYWWQRWLISPLVKWLEKKAGLTADAIWCCASDEIEFYSSHGSKAQLLDVPNGIFPEHYKKDDAVRQAMRQRLGFKDEDQVILFVGSRYAPNRDAANFILDFAVKNQVFLQFNGIYFLLVGSVFKESYRATHVTCTGFVEDVVPYFHAADLAINPIEFGSGTNVKVFEYLAAHLPLVSTAFGARGFDLTDDEDYLHFNRSSLRDTLKKAYARHLTGDLSAMAAKAFARNQTRIDMRAITQQLIEQSSRHHVPPSSDSHRLSLIHDF